MIITLILALLLVAADQISKYFVLADLKPIGDVPVIDGVLHLHYTENTGAAFGIFPDSRWFFITVSLVASVAIIVYLLRKKTPVHTFGLVTLGMILGGALGNVIDRFRFGYVVDFIYVKAINFAIFNVADSCITVGAILLCIYVIFFHDKYVEKLKGGAEAGEQVGGEETDS